MNLAQLERDVRFLKIYAVAATVVLVAILLTPSIRAQAQRQRFGEIDVERLNIVDSDGKLALIVANRQRMPGPILEGKELSPDVSQGRRGAAGLLFVDAQGNEVGGLTYRADISPDGTYSAGGSLTFDQHNQDQVVGMQYSDNGRIRSYGLSTWDRPTKISLKDLNDLQSGSTDRQEREKRFMDLAKARGETVMGPKRVFVGSQNRTASLRLMDTAGRERLRATVDDADNPRLEFLDESGKVVYSLPPQ